MTGSRSLYGCWTCRLRKKKCDETRPACLTCISLDLHCHGFGPKPEWMDRGSLQKEKALEVKHTVRNKASRQYRRQSLGALTCTRLRSNVVFDGKISLRRYSDLKSNDETDTAISPTLQEAPGDVDILSDLTTFEHPLPNQTSYEYLPDLTTFEIPLPNQSSYEYLPDLTTFEIPLPNQTSYEDFGLGKIDFHHERSNLVSNQDARGWSAAIRGANGKTNYTSDGPLARESIAISPGDNNEETPGVNEHRETTFESLLSFSPTYSQVSTNGGELAEDNASESPNIPLPSIQINPIPGLEYPWRHKARPSSQPAPVVGEDTEDVLLMHYLDEVFHIQYPFYHCSSEGRGWLLTVLRRDRSAYYATLALSGYHRHFNLSNHNNYTPTSVPLQTANTYYSLALHGTRLRLEQSSTWSGTTALDYSVETLVSILQLLYWEVRLITRGVPINTNTLYRSCSMVELKTGDLTFKQQVV